MTQRRCDRFWGWEILAIANVGFWLGVLIFLWRSLPTIPTLADEPFVQTLQGSGSTQASGGHSPIPLRPDDDLQLGKVIKQAGYRQGLAFGQGMVEVAWYHSVGEMARGLEKNSFAPFDYRIAPVLIAGVLYIFTFLLPYVGLLFAPSLAARLGFAGAVLAMSLVAAGNGKAVTQRPRLTAFTLPLAASVYMWIFLRAIGPRDRSAEGLSRVG